MRDLTEYQSRYEFLELERTDGVLTMRLHTDDGPFVWTHAVHQQLPMALADIGADPSTRVIVLTGTGDEFSDRSDFATKAPLGTDVLPTGWNQHDRIAWEGDRLIRNLLDIEVPMVAAVNGPARIHPELALLCDVVLAAQSAVFGDRPHFANGVVPGDGTHVIWPLLLGPNRSRYVLFTEQELSATDALQLGLVGEVLPDDRLLVRAQELASRINAKPRLTLRYTRNLLTRQLKRALLDDLSYGIALEGISIAAKQSEARQRDIEPARTDQRLDS